MTETVTESMLQQISSGPGCIELCWWNQCERRKDHPEGHWQLRIYARGKPVDTVYGGGYRMLDRTYRGPKLADLIDQAREEIKAQQARATPNPQLTLVTGERP